MYECLVIDRGVVKQRDQTVHSESAGNTVQPVKMLRSARIAHSSYHVFFLLNTHHTQTHTRLLLVTGRVPSFLKRLKKSREFGCFSLLPLLEAFSQLLGDTINVGSTRVFFVSTYTRISTFVCIDKPIRALPPTVSRMKRKLKKQNRLA